MVPPPKYDDGASLSTTRLPEGNGPTTASSDGDVSGQPIALGLLSSPSDHHASCPGARVRWANSVWPGRRALSVTN